MTVVDIVEAVKIMVATVGLQGGHLIVVAVIILLADHRRLIVDQEGIGLDPCRILRREAAIAVVQISMLGNFICFSQSCVGEGDDGFQSLGFCILFNSPGAILQTVVYFLVCFVETIFLF